MYEWLKDYQQLKQDIDYLKYKLDRKETEFKSWVEGDLAAELEEGIQQLKKDTDLKKQQLKKLIDLVNTFKGVEHKILKLKYVDGLTLEKIADELNYSYSHIKKKHAELVKLIKFIDEQGII
nr:sigma-70 family RNA polymerase sigma factor [Virgibacillus proomii]